MPRPVHCLLLSIATSLGFSLTAHSAQLRIAASPLTAMLNQPTVTALLRDSRDLLWIATQDGLYRYDGARMTKFPSNQTAGSGLPGGYLGSIMETPAGELFVATVGGLAQWVPEADTFVLQGVQGYEPGLHAIAGSDGSIWVGSSNGLALHRSSDPAAAQWLLAQPLNKRLGGPVRPLLETDPGTVWASGQTGVAKISLTSKTVDYYALSGAPQERAFSVTALAQHPDGGLVAGTSSGKILWLDAQSGAVLAQTALSAERNVYVTDLVFHQRTLLVATETGLYTSGDPSAYFATLELQQDALPNPYIVTLFHDKGVTWLGTHAGIATLSLSAIDYFTAHNSGIANDVLTFAEDQLGQLWVGTMEGLYVYHDATATHTRFQPTGAGQTLPQSPVSALAVAGSLLWVGFAGGGIVAIDTGTGQILRQPDLATADTMLVRDLLTLPQSPDVWVATNAQGLIRVTPHHIDYYSGRDGSPPRSSIFRLLATTDHHVLAVSDDSSLTSTIYRYNSAATQWARLTLEGDLAGKNVTIESLLQDPQGRLWLGTLGYGVFISAGAIGHSNTLIMRQATPGAGLHQAYIWDMLLDARGHVWCATSNGLAKLDSSGNVIQRITTADGLGNNETTSHASLSTPDGRLYVGDINGYSRLDSVDLPKPATPAPTRLTGISLAGVADGAFAYVQNITALQLTHRDRFVALQFAVRDFAPSQQHRFRYRLDHFDSQWIDNGARNTAIYTNLPAGQYVFRAQTANATGGWNPDGVRLEVQVLAAPWHTWWAFCGYALGLLVLAWCALRVYRSYAISHHAQRLAGEMLSHQNRADDQLQEQLALQDELVQSAYQHNKATLALIQNCLSHQAASGPEPQRQAYAAASLQRLTALSHLQSCLYYQSGSPVANLHSYTDLLLSAALARSPLEPQQIITINDVTAELLPTAVACPIAVILHELTEHCLQHALAATATISYLHLQMVLPASAAASPHTLELSVHSSNTALQPPNAPLLSGHDALAIVRALADELNGRLQITTADEGTTFILTVAHARPPP